MTMSIRNVVLLGMAAFCITNMQAMRKITRISQSHLFVLNTLLKAYPELRTRTIAIKDNMKKEGFQVGQGITEQGREWSIVHVPFTKKEVLLAERLKRDNSVLHADQMYNKLVLAGFVDLANSLFKDKRNRAFQKLWESKVHTLLEENGFACRSTTLDLWQGILLHEGAHLLYNDSIEVLPMEDALQQLKSIENPSKDTFVDLLEQILPAYKQSYLAEYRADQESIQRTDSVAVLRALSAYHQDQVFWKQVFSVGVQKSLPQRIDSLFKSHPADSIRAQYFAQAADALEKKLNKKS